MLKQNLMTLLNCVASDGAAVTIRGNLVCFERSAFANSNACSSLAILSPLLSLFSWVEEEEEEEARSRE